MYIYELNREQIIASKGNPLKNLHRIFPSNNIYAFIKNAPKSRT